MDAKKERDYGIEYAPEHLSSEEAYAWASGATQGYREGFEAALQESEAGAVAKVIRNSAGQIVMQNGEGGYFDISQYVGESFYLALPSAQAIETAAIMMCAEVCYAKMANHGDEYMQCAEALLALIPQDGRMQLEVLLYQAVVDGINRGHYCGRGDIKEMAQTIVDELLEERGIVTNLIGEKK